MTAQRLAQRWSLVKAGRKDVEDTFRESSLFCQMCKCKHGEWSLWRWLHDHSATSCERGTSFPENHCNWDCTTISTRLLNNAYQSLLTVPWHKSDSNTNWLLDCEHSPPGRSRLLHGSKDSFRLTSKPPCEAQSIVQFSLSLEQGLASLVSHDVCQIISVFSDQLIPLEQPLGTLPWRRLLEGLEGFVGSFAGGIGIFRAVVWSCGPNLAAAWIVDIEALVGLRLDPLASD